jgi:hypothetical protein
MIKKYFSLTLLFVCSAFLLSACTKAGVSQPAQEKTGNTQMEREQLKGSIKDLLGLGKNVECRWRYEDEESKMEGVAWVSGKRTRTEMKIDTSQGEMNSYFLSDGQMAYSWGDMMPALKFNLADFEDEGTEDTEAGRGANYESWDKEYDYECSNWSVDESKFAVPSGIEFADMGKQVQQMQEQVEEMSQNMKGLCESMPEPQKAECLKSLETE